MDKSFHTHRGVYSDDQVGPRESELTEVSVVPADSVSIGV